MANHVIMDSHRITNAGASCYDVQRMHAQGKFRAKPDEVSAKGDWVQCRC